MKNEVDEMKAIEEEGVLPFHKEPRVNVITKEQFEQRVRKVFHLLWETLSKSFGPYGAPTIIMNYPYSHVTKDGFTIMKNLSMDTSDTMVDQSIKDMADDICGRLNYTSGDGTTSAVIATNSIFQNYLKVKNDLDNMNVLPRDIIQKFNEIKGKIGQKLDESTVKINVHNEKDLAEKIHDVVYISSNGDAQITKYITDLYRELKSPGISCTLATDGITKKTYVDGFRFEMVITDHMYINSDEKVMRLTNSDVILFTKRITANVYNEILKPLSAQCKARGRHLIVGATGYDETALSQVISKELGAEYRKNKDINMVLTVFRSNTQSSRKRLQDFAMLMNTTPIDSAMERDILDELHRGKPIYEVFNIDDRKIEGSKCLLIGHSNVEGADTKSAYFYNYGETFTEQEMREMGIDKFDYIKNKDSDVRLGFSSECSLGLKDSMFTGKFYYDKNLYEATVAEAKLDLEDKQEKYRKLGTFNLEVTDAQNRLYALGLKMGMIEVGGDSELAGKLLKDAVDDSIKAASSAYTHGIVKGCNLDLILVIKSLMQTEKDYLNKTLLTILYQGFVDVYRTLLYNANMHKSIPLTATNLSDLKTEIKTYFENGLFYQSGLKFHDVFNESIVDQILRQQVLIDYTKKENKYERVYNLDDFILNYSIAARKVFDVTTLKFSDHIVNSVETDKQILMATIDLISLLMTGNQMVVTQKHNFED